MKRLPGLLFLLFLCSSSCLATASDTLLPRPAALEPDVQFWIRVYTQISTDAGFIHDQHDLSVVYETLHFGADTPPSARQREVDGERARFHDILTRLARGDAPANDEERRVRALWGDALGARLAAAADDVRFQLGQSDRFRAGLVRAGTWQTHIAEVLAHRGLPPELAVLPDVESSFNPAAYSKVGAAGLWQFLRSTGRRFLRIDAAVDERLDPFRETEAAAQLLAYNYRLLGTWPLAITAYNHGAAGMLRARSQLGTSDIVRIVRDYHSPTFGFASRNFYVSFLAALAVTQDPHKYFGDLPHSTPVQFHELRLPARAGLAQLLRTLNVDRRALEQLNPALRPAVWSGRRAIPAGYVLRLPASGSAWTAPLLAQRLTSAPAPTAARAVTVVQRTPEAAARPLALAATTPVLPGLAADAGGSALQAAAAMAQGPQFYLVQPQDTISTIADRTGVPLGQLMTLNAMPDQDFLYEGERLRLVPGAPAPGTATTPAMAALAQQAVLEDRQEDQAVALASQLAATAEPVSAGEAQAEGPQLLPGIGGPQSADPVDYSVAADSSIRVVAAETLGHYAQWLDLSAARLRALNHLRGRTPVVIGRRLKLEFDTVTRAQFEQRRREYHEQLQAMYFASHRITGTRIYVARRGDSLWNITKRDLKIPVWLLQQYNPELDFSALHPGTQVALPQVEDVAVL
ncbi:MAG TPA: transglycosylase SLT domain-containing protein [Steroidobacteraceae bacterium]|jgi:membrane-bound lytic murein transglycosylase D|nr:transglycosylase SLT domain-containing protein [Steroidobacteraceae bacterium]